jgi:hypothetical protein
MSRAVLFMASLTLAVAMFPAASDAADSRTRSCVREVINEWRTGPVATNHPVSCYRAALASLPEDMIIYSDAQVQIERALHVRLSRLAAKARKATPSRTTRTLAGRTAAKSTREAQGAVDPAVGDNSFPLPVIVIAAGSFVVVAAASVSRLASRLRR